MKKTLILSAVAVMILAGCSSKEPTVDTTQEYQSDSNIVSATDSDLVVIDDGAISAYDQATDNSMSGIESRLESIYFAFDKFNIMVDEAEKLTENAKLLNGSGSQYRVKIEGNCDEWGSDEYNFALSLKRAKVAKDALISKGVDASRITLVSYGESNPECTERTVQCWAKNRRDDFKLLP